jgi:hypothetical protein
LREDAGNNHVVGQNEGKAPSAAATTRTPTANAMTLTYPEAGARTVV